MATAGKIVVTDSGKRGVLASGKAAVFNADGDCEECCGCQMCTGATPKTFEVVFSGLTFCCNHYISFASGYAAEDINGELSLAVLLNTKDDPCRWSCGVILRWNVYYTPGTPHEMCLSPDNIIASGDLPVTVILEKTSSTAWLLEVRTGSVFWDPYMLFWEDLVFTSILSDQENTCDGDLVFTNTLTSCVDVDHNAGSGGTATVSVP